MALVSYNQSRVYIRPTKERQSIIKVYRDSVPLPDQTIELLALSPVFEIDECKIRTKNVQIKERFTAGESRLDSQNMVKYSMKEVDVEQNIYTDLTFYRQYPTIETEMIQHLRIDHIKGLVYGYSLDGTEIERTYPMDEVVSVEGRTLGVNLSLLSGIPVYTEVGHTFEAYSVKDGFQRIRGVTYHGPQPGLTPTPNVTYSLASEEVSAQTEIPYVTLEVHQPLTTEEVYLVYANQENVFIEVGEEDEHQHEDVYRYMKRGMTYDSVLHYYRAIAFSESGISRHSNIATAELFCDPENLTSYLDVYEEGRWISVREIEPNVPTYIGHPLIENEQFDRLLRPEDKTIDPNHIQADYSMIGRNKISLSIPNVFNQTHDINQRETYVYRISSHYLHLDKAVSPIFHFGKQYLPIERLLIYKSIGDVSLSLEHQKPDFELIRDGGLYYQPHTHQSLMKDLDVVIDPVSIFSSTNFNQSLELQDIVTVGTPIRYTFIAQDALGVKHSPVHYDIEI